MNPNAKQTNTHQTTIQQTQQGSKTKLQKKMMCKTASNFNNGMNLTANTVKADAKPTTPVKNTAS
jgi:hypothetical protein